MQKFKGENPSCVITDNFLDLEININRNIVNQILFEMYIINKDYVKMTNYIYNGSGTSPVDKNGKATFLAESDYDIQSLTDHLIVLEMKKIT